MIKKLLLLFFLTSISLFSQERKTLYGKVLDSIDVIRDAHVINLQTKTATYTNEYGDFRIFAKVGDSLKVTSVQYETKIYRVNRVSFGFNDLYIFLERKTYELDEVEVKNTDLSGSLDSDTKKTPADRRAEALENTMDFSNIDFSKKTIEEIDEIKRSEAPDMGKVTDPTRRFAGIGRGSTIPFKHSERLWALRKDLGFKKSFPARILNELGEDFFFKELKIPVERYYHFLEYCNLLGIEDSYKNGDVLSVIEILKQEQIEYLKIIKKE